MSWRDNPRSDRGGYDNDGFNHGGFRRGNSIRMDIPLDEVQKRSPEPRRKHSQDVGTGSSNGQSHQSSREKNHKEHRRDSDDYNNKLNNTYVLPKGAGVDVPIYNPRNRRPSSATTTQTFVVQANDDRQKLIKDERHLTPTSVGHVKLNTERKIISQECRSAKKGRGVDRRETEKKSQKTEINEVSTCKCCFWHGIVTPKSLTDVLCPTNCATPKFC